LIHLLQHFTPNFKPLIDITRPLHEAYCNKHGYQLHIKEVSEYPVYNGLEKLNQILEVCEEGDVALVMDADAMITNTSITIESFLEQVNDLYVSEGLNMGIFIVKISKMTLSILDTMIAEIKQNIFHCEQDAINSRYKFYPNLKVCKHPCFNSYLSELYPEIPQPVTKEQGQWEKGCFILHLPALSIEKRCKILNQIKEQIVYE